MIPVYLQQFKAAGIYRVVFDKSTILNVDSEILRLVVGYSEKGPFNIPVYITSVSDFKLYFGDISKKLEKRGIYFHRLALQALQAGPILCLNLKRFKNETVDGATINTTFNSRYESIDDVKLSVEDIYNTSRFWELDAEKLNNLKSINGQVMDQYINICATNTKETSGTYFIRKASGNKVSQFNLTVSDWYSDRVDDMPEFLEPFKNSLISDFFAEVYVFGTKFTASQVLSSSTLKKYFAVVKDEETNLPLTDDNGEPVLKLVDHIYDAYGDWVDTLDELYRDNTSHAIGHYIGCLIPEFRDKRGNYASLDTVFNQEQDEHNMMMSFNTDLLYEDEIANIDLSGRLSILREAGTADNTKRLNLKNIIAGTAKTKLLGNEDSPVITNKVSFINNVVKYNTDGDLEAVIALSAKPKKVIGTMYVSSFDADSKEVTLSQVGTTDQIKISAANASPAEFYKLGVQLGCVLQVNKNSVDETDGPLEPKVEVIDEDNNVTYHFKVYKSGFGTYYNNSIDGSPFIDAEGKFTFNGPARVITAISRLDEKSDSSTETNIIYNEQDKNIKVSIMDVAVSILNDEPDSVYGNSISFIPLSEGWDSDQEGSESATSYDTEEMALICDTPSDMSLYSFLQVGDCLLGKIKEDDKDEFFDNVYVQEIKETYNDDGVLTSYIIKLTGEPYKYNTSEVSYFVRIDAPLNQEIGVLQPKYLEGYTYESSKPSSPAMYDKLQWQKFILSALTEYKGLRTGLLNKSDIDYRYIVDTFDSYVDSSLKSTLSYLAYQKESAFAILNFPAVKTFVKCPYTSFTNSEGVFDVNYIAKGYNKKKATYVKFSLPEENEGASFCAFYTPLKFSDGYVDSIIPAAGLVSNLFMQKYMTRQPYYIIAGPNYGKITASNLIGPDYNYCREELYVMEPFGVNCMVYRPNFGTFINSNQTAKQTPVSALSKVNIRELVIYLQDEIEKVLQQYQWEFNNQITRNAILARANSICARIQANGGIEAYKNIMDESNNTPEIIENEMAILSTHIEPGFGCGKMVHELTLYRRGAMKAAISEK